MLFVFPGLTYMTTFPPLFQPWPTAGKYHSKLFPTKPPECVTARWCMQTVAGSDNLDQLSTRVGTGVGTQDLSDESLAPYRFELYRQPNHFIYFLWKTRNRYWATTLFRYWNWNCHSKKSWIIITLFFRMAILIQLYAKNLKMNALTST